jgi:hypothetical protein
VHDDGSGGTKLGGVISVGSQWNTGYDNAAVVIDDGANSPVGRIVHIEGVKLTGSWLGDGFQIRAPKAIVQIENVWIDVQHGDDKCLTGNCLHTDAIQPYGGIQELRVDGLTAAGTAMQGVLLKNDYGGVNGNMYFKRVNFNDRNTYTYGTNIIWNMAGQDTTAKQIFLDPDTVWLRTNTQGQGLKTQAYPYPSTGVISSDSISTYETWPNWNSSKVSGQVVRNWDNTAPGKIRQGTPPSGDYVTSAMTGNNYVSPGYGGTVTPPSSGTVSLTGIQNGQTVSGNITVEAVPSNASGITQIAFYIDGMLNKRFDGTDAIEKDSPYCFYGDTGSCLPYDTTKLANGSHTIRAVMTYNSGSSTAETSVTFTVNNVTTPPPTTTDTTPPSAPTNLRVTSSSRRSVSLSWSPSTDNVGVTGYYVYRSGSLDPIQLVTGTSYVDMAVTPNKNYTYYVTAVDAQYNESVASNKVSASTRR